MIDQVEEQITYTENGSYNSKENKLRLIKAIIVTRIRYD